ncbi:hypothetical protein FSP39_017947 [Pinctada imbricata]|uniref:THD domain-containing protein n=1 Tax=Pinctada imbricata TaxID=66713 RepID=A0AA89BYY2_PINIB|nr:hypothetical protein FSP39_017947 [Pinctada imbricata]
MKQHQQQSAPLIKDVNGQLRTVKEGLYLLYLNVLIQATKIAHDIGIFIDNQRKLDCRETLDYIRPSTNGNPFQFARGRRKNKRKHGKGRHRRKRCHCKRGKDGAVGPKGPRGIPGAAGAAFAIHAAHYVVDIPKPALRSFHQDNCETKWNGVLCSSNATFMNNGKGDVIQAFNTNNLNGTVTSPFSPADDGKFKILQDGLVLFYLNIAVLSKGPFRDSFAVHVDNKRIMQCTESKDITVPSDISPLFNAKEKTCSATGLYYVRKDQNVSIKILSADTAIILYPEMTYFGAVLLR